jgi:hypothetical protein
MLSTGASGEGCREMADTISRVLRAAFGLLLVLTPLSASAQVGRIFVSTDAYAGVSRIVYVGKIVELKRVDYEQRLTFIQKIGKPHRLVFEVAETIRGDEVRRLELVLSLQSTLCLEYMRDHSLQIMLVGGSTRLDSFPRAEVGIEERGKRADGEWYQFRVLDSVEAPESGAAMAIASQINTSYDSGRMFTGDLQVVASGKEILQRVRDFAKSHPETLSAVTLRVPNEFGALCGSPNAYCGISLPICPETKATLIALKADPGLILRRIESRDESYNRTLLAAEVDKALAQFPEDSGK